MVSMLQLASFAVLPPLRVVMIALLAEVLGPSYSTPEGGGKKFGWVTYFASEVAQTIFLPKHLSGFETLRLEGGVEN